MAKKRYKFRNFEFWAADGMIGILDTSKAGGDQLSVEKATIWKRPGEFMKNAISAAIMLRDRFLRHKLLEDAKACVKEAIQQGNMFDPKHLPYIKKDRKIIQVSTVGLHVPQRENIVKRLTKHSIKADDVKNVMINGPEKFLEGAID